MTAEKKIVKELEDLETPVAPLHPAFGGAVVRGGLRVRTDIRAGSLAARGNIVQCYPAKIDDPGLPGQPGGLGG